jgi:hypothetical protein
MMTSTTLVSIATQRVCGIGIVLFAIFQTVGPQPAEAESTDSISIADLEGLTVDAKIVYARTVRYKGNIRNNQSHQEFRLRIGPNGAIWETEKYTTVSPRGEVVASRTNNNHYTIGHVIDREKGHVVWAFADASLTRLNTRAEGGRKMTYLFKRSANGFACDVSAPYMREDGVGRLQGKAMRGGTVEFLAIKQVAATCRVGKS